MEELADLHRRGNTIIMVTHNPELTSYASRVITMLDGKIDTDKTLAKKTIFSKKLEIKDVPSQSKVDIKQAKSKKTSKRSIKKAGKK